MIGDPSRGSVPLAPSPPPGARRTSAPGVVEPGAFARHARRRSRPPPRSSTTPAGRTRSVGALPCRSVSNVMLVGPLRRSHGRVEPAQRAVRPRGSCMMVSLSDRSHSTLRWPGQKVGVDPSLLPPPVGAPQQRRCELATVVGCGCAPAGPENATIADCAVCSRRSSSVAWPLLRSWVRSEVPCR